MACERRTSFQDSGENQRPDQRPKQLLLFQASAGKTSHFFSGAYNVLGLFFLSRAACDC